LARIILTLNCYDSAQSSIRLSVDGRQNVRSKCSGTLNGRQYANVLAFRGSNLEPYRMTTGTRIRRNDGLFGPHEEDETDERGLSVDWMDILETLDTLTKEIISRKAETVAGLAVQARAMTVYYAELWDVDDDNHDHRNFIEAVCAFVGITPEPLLAARLGGGVQS
jgi:hypothetical protein